MSTEQPPEEENLFDSVRSLYAIPESLAHYGEFARNVGLAPPERAMIERFMSPPGAVLDMGCGAGREAFALAKIGYSVTGVDITPELLQLAKALSVELGLDVDFRLGNGRSLDFPAASFDYVLLITQMIHSVPLRANRVALFREAQRVVKPEGRVLLTYNDYDIAKTHTPWGGDRPPTSTAEAVARGYPVLEPGDRFDDECQGQTTGVYGYHHDFTRNEIEKEVLASGLEIVDRACFYAIAGGEPDEFWKPTRILVLKSPS